MSLGILSGPGVLPLVSLFTQLSYISLVNCELICAFWAPRLSSMIRSYECHGYFRIAHLHVRGWSIVSSQMDVYR
jgi:hypothetical protein